MARERSTVTLRILTEHVERARPHFDEKPEDEGETDELSTFTFYDVVNGSLNFLKALESEGIPYDAEWEGNHSYAAGTHYVRFDKAGQLQTNTIDEYDEHIDLATLVQLMSDPPQLIELIKNRHEANYVMPWDDQADYSNRYRTLQLITPPERK